jgi:hypothetical protein
VVGVVSIGVVGVTGSNVSTGSSLGSLPPPDAIAITTIRKNRATPPAAMRRRRR